MLERVEGPTMLAEMQRRPWRAPRSAAALARLFLRHVDHRAARHALPDAVAFRLADPNVTAAERARVRRLLR